MGQKLLPDNVPSVVRASGTSLTLATTNNGQPTRITIAGQQYKLSTALSLSSATSGIGGIDTGSIAANTLYYVYAVVSSGTVGMIISTTGPTTGPTGFTTRNKLIAKLRTDLGASTINTVVTLSEFQPQGSISELTQFTPASSNNSFGTFGQSFMYWKREGSSMRIIGAFTLGTLPGSTQARFTIPDGKNSRNIDLSAGYGMQIGTWVRNNSSANTSKRGTVFTRSDIGTTSLYFALDDYTNAIGPAVPVNSTDLASSGQVIFTAGEGWLIPIAEWQDLYT